MRHDSTRSVSTNASRQPGSAGGVSAASEAEPFFRRSHADHERPCEGGGAAHGPIRFHAKHAGHAPLNITMKKITTSLVLLALSGSSLRAEAFRKVQEEVSERTGVDVRWEKEMASREETSAIVQKLLKKPLTVSSAVQIALLNNRELQATFEEVGIAQADVIEAVTLPNPSVDFEVQFPLVAGTLNRYAWLVAQEFVQILMIPLKKKTSEERLEAAELRVADETLKLVEKVKAAFFMVQADQQLISRLKLIQETNPLRSNSARNNTRRGILRIWRCCSCRHPTARDGLISQKPKQICATSGRS